MPDEQQTEAIPPAPPLPPAPKAPRTILGFSTRQAVIVAAAVVIAVACGIGIGAAIWQPQVSAASADAAALEDNLAGVSDRLEEMTDARDDAQAQVGQLQEDAARAESELSIRASELQAREDAVAAREGAVQATEDRIAANSFGDGVRRVGADIEPGTYRTDGTSSCYWARLSGGGGTVYDIIANDNASGPTTVTIAGSDWGFQSNRCGTWTKVG